MSRLPDLTPARLDPEQRALYDEITTGPRARGPQHFALTAPDGSLNGPFGPLLTSPAVGQALQSVGAAVRYGTHLSDRTRESAILLVAAREDCAFEQHAHESVGRAIGLTDDDLATLRGGGIPASASGDERAQLELVQALLRGDVTDEEWARWTPLGEQALFELATLVGYYATLALQLRVFRIGVPPEG